MVYRKVLQWPDSRLKEISQAVLTFDDSLVQLVNDMCDTVNVVLGAGLAAPQIGVHKRVVVLRCAPFEFSNPSPHEKDKDICVLINPELELSGDESIWQESCLSVPKYSGKVRRRRHANLKYQDINGISYEMKVNWPFSGALQHECDHLDGIVFIDRLGKRAQQEIKRKIYRALRIPPHKVKKPKVEKEPMDTRLTHGPGKRKKKRQKRKK
jgi:peptide deformylase